MSSALLSNLEPRHELQTSLSVPCDKILDTEYSLYMYPYQYPLDVAIIFLIKVTKYNIYIYITNK